MPTLKGHHYCTLPCTRLAINSGPTGNFVVPSALTPKTTTSNRSPTTVTSSSYDGLLCSARAWSCAVAYV